MITGNEVYYPLQAGFEWTYQLKDGSTYTNKVTSVNPSNPHEFTMINSMMNKNQIMRKDGNNYLTDSFEEGTMQILLKDDLTVGNSWEVKFKANGFDNILVFNVKEVGSTKEVNGKTYNAIAMIEAESKMLMNGNLMSLNFFTQYYYAKGVGLVLTTSSLGDSQSLISTNVV
ncbi:hypothetical protein AD998_11135 [bacterium 336/3]|nr:hypothetical protein AD998_11135 [bacterium 336/3]